MIYTITLNPAVIHDLYVDDFNNDSSITASSSLVSYQGKGFNVSKMLKNLETNSIATGFIGGQNGVRLEHTLQQAGIDTLFTKTEAETQSKVCISQVNNTQSFQVQDVGPDITSQEANRFIDLVRKNTQANDWWVLSGSLPNGLDDDFYAVLIKHIEKAGAHTILDTCGEALVQGCQAKPTLVKPSFGEAIALLNLPESDSLGVLEIADNIRVLGPQTVIMTMGSNGAVLSTINSTLHYPSPKITKSNPSGAGDALIGGLAWGLHQKLPIEYALRCGIACGAATAGLDRQGICSLVEVQKLLGEIESQNNSTVPPAI